MILYEKTKDLKDRAKMREKLDNGDDCPELFWKGEEEKDLLIRQSYFWTKKAFLLKQRR